MFKILTILISAVLLVCFSCNNAETSKTYSDSTVITGELAETGTKVGRQTLIKELEKLKVIFASKDKEKIASIFSFPVSDTTLGIYIDDSLYLEQFRNNNDMTTRNMFLQFFPKIYESLQIEEVNQLFKYIDPKALIRKDTLQHEAHIKTNPCYKFYSITVEGNFITLSTGSGVNENYQSPSLASGDELQENSSELCEHILWWVFKFDGEKLHFVKQHGAG
jgi:hypothetical protein